MPRLNDQISRALLFMRSPSILTYGIAGFVAAASFLSTLLLARLSGAEVIGQYALAMSTAHLLASFAVLGLDRIIVREVAGDLRIGEVANARRVTRHLALAVALVSITVAIAYLAFLLLTPLNIWINGDWLAMGLVTASILVWPMQRLGYSALRAMGFQLKGQMIETFPTVFFLGAVTLALFLQHHVSAPLAAGTMVFGQLLAGIIAWSLVRPIMRRWPRTDVPIDPLLLRAGFPMMGSLFLQIFSDWIILAAVSADASAAEAGAFRVAIQIVTIVLTLISTTELFIAARLAGDFRAGRPDLAWKRHRRASILMVAIAMPLVAIMVLFPAQLLGGAFGPEFVIAAPALAIMAGGQFVVALRGPIGAMLSMSGNEPAQLKLTVAGFVLLLVLAYILIPIYG
ncbi:MAG: oligosaccharide flippase family protein, partial [Sandarakinorhabdus sp.]|nr:oligosaccharide flippase family protein [Sandarakinorhabdus sp.]